MNMHSKPVKIGLFFLGLIAVCGLVLLFKGNDAVAMAKEKRDGIVTAEQIKVSFDSVSGRLLKENVKEGDRVKKGDVLMVMDPTDTDLDIKKLRSQIAQLDAQISSMAGSIDVAYQKADTDEVETHRQIDQQKAVLASSQAVYENKLSDYNRKRQLVEAGAISQLEMDNITASLRTAEADVRAQQELLHKLLGGAEDLCAEKYLLPLQSGRLSLPARLTPNDLCYLQAAACLRELEDANRAKRPGYELLVKGALLRFLALLIAQGRQCLSTETADTQRLKTVLQWLSAHYAEPLRVADAAGVCSFSASHFMRWFRQMTGQSFIAFLNEYRLNTAAETLRTTDETVLTIASRCGFENLSYFNRAFKAHFGMTPRDYRKK